MITRFRGGPVHPGWGARSLGLMHSFVGPPLAVVSYGALLRCFWQQSSLEREMQKHGCIARPWSHVRAFKIDRCVLDEGLRHALSLV